MSREPQPCPMRDAVEEIERSGLQPPPLPAEVVDELVEQLRHRRPTDGPLAAAFRDGARSAAK
jgi:hypothetical protein